MRFVTFVPPDGQPRAGTLLGPIVIDLATAAPLVFEETEAQHWDMLSLLRDDTETVNLDTAIEIHTAVASMLGGGFDTAALSHNNGNYANNGDYDSRLVGGLSIGGETMALPLNQVKLLAPLQRPTSLRLFSAFEDHAIALYRQFNQTVPAEWYRFPAFAFGNSNAIYGSTAAIPYPQSEALDYELSLACVIGRMGCDIAEEEAMDYIAGYMIMNGWSARDIQTEEQAIGFGSAKAKDFAVSLGPWLVTPDELAIYTDEDGRMSLTMLARVNGHEYLRGNAAIMHYTFAQMIAYASRDTTLYPGDVLSSGAVGGGCLLERTGGYGPWLQKDDVVELEITGLGVLRNHIV